MVFMKKHLTVISKKHPFMSYYIFSNALYAMCVIFQYISYFLFGKTTSAIFTVFLFLFCLFLLLEFGNSIQKRILLNLEYNGKNIHLFTRAITYANLITTVAISFLVGVKPAIYSYLLWPTTNDMGSFLFDISFAWIGCTASAERILLEHIEKIWYRQEDKRHRDKRI